MEKECEFCGKLFEARNCRCKFCSPRCKEGTKHTKSERDERDKKIVELRLQNLSCGEIGEIVGLSEARVLSIAKAHGVDGRRAPYKTGTPNQFTKRTEEEKRDYVEKFLDCERFEYVDGYEHCDSMVRLKCKICGLVFERSMTSIRHYATTCPHCIEVEWEKQREDTKERKRAKRAKIAEENRKKREALRAKRKAEKLSEIERRKTVKICPVCGGCFKTTNSRTICCSDKCRKTWGYRRKDKRISKEQYIDNNISAIALMERDGGICQLCGLRCDLDDYVLNEDGTFIAGDYYPSVDHIVPISKGGLHSWKNVRLAHRKCNLRVYAVEQRHIQPLPGAKCSGLDA
jgi:5-methylcytosine-specific restriction endonuclease McrA